MCNLQGGVGTRGVGCLRVWVGVCMPEGLVWVCHLASQPWRRVNGSKGGVRVEFGITPIGGGYAIRVPRDPPF